jgi:hypothetical protein
VEYACEGSIYGKHVRIRKPNNSVSSYMSYKHFLSVDKPNFSFYFVADEVFPLSRHMIQPFPETTLTKERQVFNYRLSRARKSVECAFGMLCSKFKVLDTTTNCNLETVDNIIKCVCILHNFVRMKEGKLSEPLTIENNCDADGIRVSNCFQQTHSGQPTDEGVLVSYFFKSGVALPWESKYYF